jgi:hypothetical protein
MMPQARLRKAAWMPSRISQRLCSRRNQGETLLQGLGAIGGSAMSGVTFWAVAGPVIALAGLAMAAIGLRRRLAS